MGGTVCCASSLIRKDEARVTSITEDEQEFSKSSPDKDKDFLELE